MFIESFISSDVAFINPDVRTHNYNCSSLLWPKVLRCIALHCLSVGSSPLYTVSSCPASAAPPSPQDRWLACDLERNQFLDGFVGFGGGRYQCPGRWFALMEMHLFTVTVLRMFDLELLDPVPPPVSQLVSSGDSPL